MDKIAKKVNSSLAFVKRNLFACSEETKCTAYVPLDRPHLECVSSMGSLQTESGGEPRGDPK